jgi:hypothetical protein
MSLRFDGGGEGDVVILNRCPKCCRFIKNSSLPQSISVNCYGTVKEPLTAICQKCGEVKLEWWRD